MTCAGTVLRTPVTFWGAGFQAPLRLRARVSPLVREETRKLVVTGPNQRQIPAYTVWRSYAERPLALRSVP